MLTQLTPKDQKMLVSYYLKQADNYNKQNNYNKAETLYKQALRFALDKDKAVIYNNYAVIFLKQHLFKRGLELLVKAIKLDNKNYLIRKNLVKAYFQSNNKV